MTLRWGIAALLLLACGSAPPAPPAAAPADPELARIVAFLGPTHAISLEDEMPLEVRMQLPAREQKLSPGEWLELAQEHGSKQAVATPDQAAAFFQNGLGTCALAERATHGDTNESYEASSVLASMLFDVTQQSAGMQMLGATVSGVTASTASAKAGNTLAVEKQLPADILSQILYHEARVLRAGRPATAVSRVLALLLSSTALGDVTELVIARYLRGEPEPAPAVLVSIANARSTRPDAAAFTTSLQRAKTRLAQLPAESQRPLLAKLHSAEVKHGFAERLARARGDSFEARLERFDAATQLRDAKVSRAELDALEKLAPGDGRVRARAAFYVLRETFMQDGFLAASAAARRAYARVPITKPAPEDARFHVGLEIADLVASAATSKDLGQSFAPIAAAITRFAEVDPAGAAGAKFALARYRTDGAAMERMVTPDALDAGFVEVSALRKQFPQNVDVVRLAHWYAMRVPDHAKALALVLDASGVDPAQEPLLALERVAVILSLVAASGNAAPLADVRRTLETFQATEEGEIENQRVVQLADLSMLEALAGNQARWADAEALYARAATVAPKQKGRLLNNQGFARGRATGASGLDLYRSAVPKLEPNDDTFGMIPHLNAGMVAADPAAIAAEAEPMLRDLKDADLVASAIIVLRWLAIHPTATARAKVSAKRALASRQNWFEPAPKAEWPLVCEANRDVTMGLGTEKMGYFFVPGAGCALWLVEGGLPSAAALRKLAR